jgi:hypothetical protein
MVSTPIQVNSTLNKRAYLDVNRSRGVHQRFSKSGPYKQYEIFGPLVVRRRKFLQGDGLFDRICPAGRAKKGLFETIGRTGKDRDKYGQKSG